MNNELSAMGSQKRWERGSVGGVTVNARMVISDCVELASERQQKGIKSEEYYG